MNKEQKSKKQMFEAIGLFIQEERKKANVSQGDIAKKLGLESGQYCSNIERGISPPSMEFLVVFIKLTGIDSGLVVDKISFETHEHYKRSLK